MVGRNKLPSVILATAVTIAIFTGIVALPDTVAAANNSTIDARSTTPVDDPVTVFMGERGLNLRHSEDDTTGDSLTVNGVAGQADGTTATIDPNSADITESNGFSPGSYYISQDGEDDVDLRVRSIGTTDVTVYRGSGTDGKEITSGSLDIGKTFTVEGEFNFGEAAPAKVVIEDKHGNNVTTQALTSDDIWLVSSGDTAEFDSQSLDTEEYMVRVRGSDQYRGNTETDFSTANYVSRTLTLQNYETGVSLNTDQVSQGNVITGTITGAPGGYGVVRIPTTTISDSTDLETIADGSGEDLFRSTADQSAIGIDDGQSAIAAEYSLGEDAEAQFQIDTEYIAKGTTTSVEVVGFDSSGQIADGSAFSADTEASTSFDVCQDDVECQKLGDATSNGIALGDLDGDGTVDVFVANDGANTVWLNDGSGGFTNTGQSLGSATSQDVALADLDGDSDQDAFVANDGTNQVWLNDGTGSFSKSEQSTILGALSVDVENIGGSSHPDAVLARAGPNGVWINEESDAADSRDGTDSNSAGTLRIHEQGTPDESTMTPESEMTTTATDRPNTRTRSSPSPTSTATATGTPTATQTMTRTPSPTSTPTPTSGPGFGELVALFTLLFVGILYRHN